jgi:hypothetical protein
LPNEGNNPLTRADKKRQVTEYTLVAPLLFAFIKISNAFEFRAVVLGLLFADRLGKPDYSLVSSPVRLSSVGRGFLLSSSSERADWTKRIDCCASSSIWEAACRMCRPARCEPVGYGALPPELPLATDAGGQHPRYPECRRIPTRWPSFSPGVFAIHPDNSTTYSVLGEGGPADERRKMKFART